MDPFQSSFFQGTSENDRTQGLSVFFCTDWHTFHAQQVTTIVIDREPIVRHAYLWPHGRSHFNGVRLRRKPFSA